MKIGQKVSYTTYTGVGVEGVIKAIAIIEATGELALILHENEKSWVNTILREDIQQFSYTMFYTTYGEALDEFVEML